MQEEKTRFEQEQFELEEEAKLELNRIEQSEQEHFGYESKERLLEEKKRLEWDK